tara:strand:- start:1160 stop:1339 length:180 start_codon:yes stop_codon:yes gene_type:complete
MMNSSLLISSLKELPRFEGSHCPNQSNHEYIKRVDTGKYVRLEDVIKILENKDREGYYK